MTSSDSKTLIADRPTHILHRTPWRPPVAVAANGVYIYLEDGKRLIDGSGGAAVVSVGHGHPVVQKAIQEQIEKVSYVYNMQLSNEPAEKLADTLIADSKGAFELCGLSCGGTEAMESVLKLARQYFYETNEPQRTNFIGRQLSFHGNSMATLALAGFKARRAPYEAVLDPVHFHHVSPAFAKRFQLPDETEEQYVERLRKELEDKFIELGGNTVIAFVAETVVGAVAGCVPPPKGYFPAMKSVCDKYGALFILDEVMCGMGRMGTLHAWETYGDGVTPDIQAVAKGLGGGYATVGAILMSKKIADGIRDGSGFWKHGHTYQGHPVACATSLAVQKVMKEENLLENCRKQGAYLAQLLRERLQGEGKPASPFTLDVRGGGCFWGVDFEFECPQAAKLAPEKSSQFGYLVQARALELGLILMGFSGGGNLDGNKGSHLVLAPPYSVTKEEIEEIVNIVVRSVEEILQEIQK